MIQNLDNEILIETDFMKTMGIILDMKNSRVVLLDRIAENMKAEEERKIKNIQQVKRQINLVYKTMIPKNHHIKAQCTISAANNVNIRPGSLTKTEQKEILPGVILEEVLTKVLNRNRIFVVITNNNPYQVCLKPSMVLCETKDIEAKLLPVNEAKISSFNMNATGVIPECSAEKRQYLVDNLKCPSDKHFWEEYETLILKNHDVFAKDKYDLGFSEAVSHKINMKNNQPIFIKQFCIPDAHQEVILEHINEWQNKKVIEECSSPYNSPVFCVPKRRRTPDCTRLQGNKQKFLRRQICNQRRAGMH